MLKILLPQASRWHVGLHLDGETRRIWICLIRLALTYTDFMTHKKPCPYSPSCAPNVQVMCHGNVFHSWIVRNTLCAHHGVPWWPWLAAQFRAFATSVERPPKGFAKGLFTAVTAVMGEAKYATENSSGVGKQRACLGVDGSGKHRGSWA